ARAAVAASPRVRFRHASALLRVPVGDRQMTNVRGPSRLATQWLDLAQSFHGRRSLGRAHPAGMCVVRPGCAAVVAACVLACALAGCDRLADRQVEKALTRARADLLKSPDLRVVLGGTGTPLPDPARAGACTAVLAGGEFVLVDVGPGSWETVDLANLPTAGLSAILLTHFHSDHIGDLGEAVTQSWIAGRTSPLDVYGPPGVEQVVGGFAQAYALDAAARVTHHGEGHMPAAAGRAISHEVAMPDGDAAALVFDRNGLRVTMFRVDHAPVVPAVGYRFDFGGRSVVVSG